MMTTIATISHFGTTTLHPTAVAMLLGLVAAVFAVPRRYALVPLLIVVCCVPMAQRIVPWGIDLSFLRIMVIAGWLRCMVRGELWQWRWNRLDAMFTAWVVVALATNLLLQMSFDGTMLQFGLTFDAIGLYFFTRFVVHDGSDLIAFARASAVLAVPVAALFLLESVTQRNLFATFGGVPEFTTLRAGRVRCQGPFSHPILAGTLWAILMPIMGALLFQRPSDRVFGLLGLCGALVVIVTCGSATPVNGLVFGVCAMALFPLRHYLQWVRWAGVACVIALQLVMQNPLWHLLSRADILTAGSGWHRFKVFDSFVRHFGDWWLIGTRDYHEWWSTGLSDITNAYVQQGVNGGLLTLALFGALIIVGFAAVGRTIRRAERPTFRVIASPAERRSASRRPPLSPSLIMAWSLGVMLFIHCVVFTSIAQFGQSIFIWYTTLALIASVAPSTRMEPRHVRVRPVDLEGLAPAT